jgi:hypothetical protein
VKQSTETKAPTGTHSSPDVGFEKGSSSELKQFAPQIAAHEETRVLTESKQYDLEKYDTPLEAEQHLNQKSNPTSTLRSSSNCVAKQKRRVFKKRSQTRPRILRQKKLSYFLN